ncbi:spore germination protein [Paenibacillus sp. FSL P4-0338]|uniref:spore germination protein n=1 Tax=Paenibacillus sp. FSL P4-0338 TaxID=2921635 RepID=UPI0030F854FD
MLKYFFVIAAAMLGLVGVVVCLVGFTMYLCSQRSFGQPYFKMFFLDTLGTTLRKKSVGDDGKKPLFLLSVSHEFSDQYH